MNQTEVNRHNHPLFSFDDLLRAAHCEKVTWGNENDYSQFFAAMNLDKMSGGSVIAVDGPTGVGKTTFCLALCDFFSKLRKSPTISPLLLDWFLTSPASRADIPNRMARGDMEASDYSPAVWHRNRMKNLIQEVRTHFRTKPDRNYNATFGGLYNRTNGFNDLSLTLELPSKVPVVLDGVGMLDPFFDGTSDCGIRLDVRDERLLVERKILRERIKPRENQLLPAFIEDRFWSSEFYHVHFLRKATANRFAYLFDMTNLSDIVLYRAGAYTAIS